MEEHRDLWWNSPTVELGRVVHLNLPEPFRAEAGGELPAVQVAYESWGELSEDRDNAVLVVHPLTADCHVTGEFAGQPTGWWEPLVGPGRAIDTDRHFVICPNLVGGCYGTTGPRFPAPDGSPYYDRFPLLTPRDMMRVQALFLDALGIRRPAMVIGPSMGGMIAWEWAIEASARVGRAVVVAAPIRTSPHQIGLNWLQRRGIELDISENEVVARWGQMVARGVGMLSYRDPVGLEEKFGREWFKKPGSTLGERGMFNIESWLRHHGKRITKRFDPYTYLLYSRAMDLHDVSEGRGDLVNALGRVSCSVQVMGVSSDNLYPPGEVKMGVDVLEHLGGDVRYGEIRSPNGHDAFLLDTDQIDAFLRGWGAEEPAGEPAVAIEEIRPVRIGILGAGRVAAAFVRLLRERRDLLAMRNRLALEVAGVAEIDPQKTLDPVFEGVDVVYAPEALVGREDLDVVVDLTRGLGARGLVEQALSLGHSVVTPNKVMLRAHGDRMESLAGRHGARLAYHDSIAAGWPLIHALTRPLSQGRVTEIRAMLSSAANVMLELMEEGASLAKALRTAMDRDLTEPDPALDVSGWDTAQKLTLLLTRASGRRHSGRDLEVMGIDALNPDLVRRAPDLGLRIKLVGLAARAGERLRATVRPLAVARESHLGLVRGGNNVVVIHAPDGGEMVFLGTGGGSLPVATAVLNDVIGIFDPARSWTGRYPAARERVESPAFREWLSVRGDGLLRTTTAEPGAVPILPVLGETGGESG